MPRNCSALCKRPGTQQNFTDQFPALERQLTWNRKSTTLFAMKYAIDEGIFLGMRVVMCLQQGTPKRRTVAQSRGPISHEVRDWHEIVFTSLAQVRSGDGLRKRRAEDVSQARAETPRSKLAMNDSIG